MTGWPALFGTRSSRDELRAPRRGDGRPRRPREVLADPATHRDRSRSPGGGKATRPHDRPRVRVDDAPVRQGDRIRRRPRPRAVRPNHARGGGTGSPRAVRRRGGRGLEAAVGRAPADRRPARGGRHRHRPHEAGPGRRRDPATTRRGGTWPLRIDAARRRADRPLLGRHRPGHRGSGRGARRDDRTRPRAGARRAAAPVHRPRVHHPRLGDRRDGDPHGGRAHDRRRGRGPSLRAPGAHPVDADPPPRDRPRYPRVPRRRQPGGDREGRAGSRRRPVRPGCVAPDVAHRGVDTPGQGPRATDLSAGRLQVLRRLGRARRSHSPLRGRRGGAGR